MGEGSSEKQHQHSPSVVTPKKVDEPTRAKLQLLVLAVVPILCFICILKFDLGFARDWDAFIAYPSVAAMLAVAAYWTAGRSRRIFLMVTLIAGVHSLVLFTLNATSDESVRRFRTILDKRTFTQGAMYNATIALALYYHQAQQDTAVVPLWRH